MNKNKIIHVGVIFYRTWNIEELKMHISSSMPLSLKAELKSLYMDNIYDSREVTFYSKVLKFDWSRCIYKNSFWLKMQPTLRFVKHNDVAWN